MQNEHQEMRRVLFLCTGNYYRSRFAEIYFNWHVKQRGLDWTADSRGLGLDEFNNGHISSHTIASLKARGIESDTCERLPLPVTEADLAAAHRIIAVKEHEHRPMVEAKFPAWRDRIEYWHVHDLDCATADVAIPHLEREVVRLLDRLTRERTAAA
jgi:protein-tyrosine phosphatase